MSYQQIPQGKDPYLWDLAKKRTSFKSHLTVYIVITIFFWLLWYFSGAKVYNGEGMPWPVWPMLGWGVGIVFHYIGAYVTHKTNSVENEYNKLTNKQNQ